MLGEVTEGYAVLLEALGPALYALGALALLALAVETIDSKEWTEPSMYGAALAGTFALVCWAIGTSL